MASATATTATTTTDDDDDKRMVQACQEGDQVTVKNMLDKNGMQYYETKLLSWCDTENVSLETPAIFIAIDYRQVEIVKLLLSKSNAYANIKDSNDYSPLTWACMNDTTPNDSTSFVLVELLLEHGAVVDQDAIDMAKEKGHTSILEKLRSNFDVSYADIDPEDVDEIMIKASREGDVKKVRELIANGYDFDKWKEDGETSTYLAYSPMMFAMRNGHTEIIQEFLQAGVQAELEETHFHYDDDDNQTEQKKDNTDEHATPDLTDEQLQAMAAQLLLDDELNDATPSKQDEPTP